jgi:SAM-dependent methyltransferase
MKTRESGMPIEDMWAKFFDPTQALLALGLTSKHCSAVDFGCGYGTFSIPAAEIISGTVYAIDIDSQMIAAVRAKAGARGLTNLHIIERNFIELGTGLGNEVADYVMLFNILHAEMPEVLLMESRRILRSGGILGIMHWNYDPSTPRGPSMEIRLQPAQCIELVKRAGFRVEEPCLIDLPPYHFGFVGRK